MAYALRLAVGPLVTLVTVGAILATDRYLFAVPNPGAITFVAVVFATYIGGLPSGFMSAAISLTYAAVYFSIPGEFLHFSPDNLARMVVQIFGTPAVVIMVGLLQRRAESGLRQERIAHVEIENGNRELRWLHASLDKVDYGVVLLDSELRAQFINRAFRKMWRLPDDKADNKPAFDALMLHGRAIRAYAVPDSEIDAYVAERTAKVRAGDETPIDLRLVSGEVIRFKCKALPDGGRMLSYVHVTDLVHHNDRLETLRAALEEVDHGILLLDRELRTEFMNRAVRELGGLREPAPGERPLYADLVRHVAANGAYAVAADELETYVAGRIEWVRRADLAPSQLRLADGRVIDVRCIELRDQARMLTYTDVTGHVCRAEELESLATLDGLTSLYNRRHFLTLAESEWGRAKRYERPLSLLMLDVDRFKSINDRFGHDAGDKVIMDVARTCMEMKRGSDVVSRIGGEEFALLLPETDMEGALLVAERLRSGIAKRPVLLGRASITVGVSIGVAGAAPSITGIHELMKRADEALYAAKRGGRNRVVAMGPVHGEAVIRAIDRRVA